MKTSSIRVEGNIISPELFGRIDSGDIFGQNPADFGLDANQKVKDEIARAWADAKDQWNIFKRRTAQLDAANSGTEETRRYWIIPLLENLGYTPRFRKAGEVVNEKTYPISHADEKRDNFPVHIVGINDSLDKRRETGGPRMSPHALLQEYLNVTEHLYGIVTNGIFLRLLRDSGKLVRLSYLECNLERMLEDDLYAEFSLMYRLLHASRMPRSQTETEESIVEQYHQDSLESGSRIRENLSSAVEISLRTLANGFLSHPANTKLREEVISGRITPGEYYLWLLRLIYRLLFLMVIEERDLVYPETGSLSAEEKTGSARLRNIYDSFYSVSRLRRLADKLFFFDDRNDDLWLSLRSCFLLFESERHGRRLGIYPLGGDLFSSGSVGHLAHAALGNRVLLECITKLSVFENPAGNTLMRVNYAALNVEEFGSVYEGMLEYSGAFSIEGNTVSFQFVKSSERSSSGSHYTPEELVQPLIKNSLDYLIADRLELARRIADGTVKSDWSVVSGKGSVQFGKVKLDLKEAIAAAHLSTKFTVSAVRKSKGEAEIIAWWNGLTPSFRHSFLSAYLLLSLRVCDAACGSGHILLSAARRVALELARVRTGEDQPSPAPYRIALREVINHCIYGVDKNPLAVELCKVALWLESYSPGLPLSFLDHKIKCGDSIVGLAHREELMRGIAEEAFKKLPGDDPAVVKELLRRQKQEKAGVAELFDEEKHFAELNSLSLEFSSFSEMPELTLEEVQKKAEKYSALKGSEWWRLHEAADMMVAQFFISKTKENLKDIATHSDYISLFSGSRPRVAQKVARAMAVSREKRFFHWFLEFPDIMAAGGFDCMLGNPPFLGGQRLSGTFGDEFLNWVKTAYAPAGSVDLVTYFFRREYTLLNQGGFQSLISTNTIAQGNAREGGLEVMLADGGSIVHAVRSTPWPGVAAVEVSLVTVYKGTWSRQAVLGKKQVPYISSYLDDTQSIGNPFPLKMNEGKSFQGSIVLGKGFILEPEEAERLIRKNPKNKDVLFPYLNGDDLNSRPDQSPSRWVINFFDWEEDYCRKNYPDCFEIVERLVKPERMRLNQDNSTNINRRRKWWLFGSDAKTLYRTIAGMERVLVTSEVTKHLCFTFIIPEITISSNIDIFAVSDDVDFSILQSTIHNYWARKYCSHLELRLKYSPTNGYENFPIPNLNNTDKIELKLAGKNYLSLRVALMLKFQIGLTKLYNLFHSPPINLKKSNGRELMIDQYSDVDSLRSMRVKIDNILLKSYGWSDINFAHDFYEVDYLPENDNIRFTISPEARKEVLKRLLELNHKLHAEEVKAGLWDKPKAKSKTLSLKRRGQGEVAPKPGAQQDNLFE